MRFQNLQMWQQVCQGLEAVGPVRVVRQCNTGSVTPTSCSIVMGTWRQTGGNQWVGDEDVRKRVGRPRLHRGTCIPSSFVSLTYYVIVFLIVLSKKGNTRNNRCPSVNYIRSQSRSYPWDTYNRLGQSEQLSSLQSPESRNPLKQR